MSAQHKLTNIQVRNLKPDEHNPKKRLISDGGGLYLSMSKSGSKSWIFRYRTSSGQRDLGLGGYPATTLALARKKAQICREARASGEDPTLALKPAPTMTFKAVMDKFMIDKRAEQPSEIVLKEWVRLHEVIARPIHDTEIAEVTVDDIIRILRPTWFSTPVATKTAQQRLERIFRWAKANRLRTGPNPAAWKENLEDALPVQNHQPKHHPALDFRQLPAFIVWLREQNTDRTLALELLILTGSRTSEVRKAEISEFMLDDAIWKIPGERMKNGKEHVVPLSARALEIVTQATRRRTSGYLFASNLKHGMLPMNAITDCLPKYGLSSSEATVHGFRSTFRDWAGDTTDYSREVAEAALSHQIGSTVERSYRRNTALEKRRNLMNDWADFCGSSLSADQNDAAEMKIEHSHKEDA